MEINSAVAAQIAQTRQNSILDASISRVPGSPVRGVNVDINA